MAGTRVEGLVPLHSCRCSVLQHQAVDGGRSVGSLLGARVRCGQRRSAERAMPAPQCVKPKRDGGNRDQDLSCNSKAVKWKGKGPSPLTRSRSSGSRYERWQRVNTLESYEDGPPDFVATDRQSFLFQCPSDKDVDNPLRSGLTYAQMITKQKKAELRERRPPSAKRRYSSPIKGKRHPEEEDRVAVPRHPFDDAEAMPGQSASARKREPTRKKLVGQRERGSRQTGRSDSAPGDQWREEALQEVSNFVIENSADLCGAVPTWEYLSDCGRTDLAHKVRRLGGAQQVAAILGLKISDGRHNSKEKKSGSENPASTRGSARTNGQAKQRPHKVKAASTNSKHVSHAGGELVRELSSLAELRREGLLTEAEFTHAKAKLLEFEAASLGRMRQASLRQQTRRERHVNGDSEDDSPISLSSFAHHVMAHRSQDTQTHMGCGALADEDTLGSESMELAKPRTALTNGVRQAAKASPKAKATVGQTTGNTSARTAARSPLVDAPLDSPAEASTHRLFDPNKAQLRKRIQAGLDRGLCFFLEHTREFDGDSSDLFWAMWGMPLSGASFDTICEEAERCVEEYPNHFVRIAACDMRSHGEQIKIILYCPSHSEEDLSSIQRAMEEDAEREKLHTTYQNGRNGVRADKERRWREMQMDAVRKAER